MKNSKTTNRTVKSDVLLTGVSPKPSLSSERRATHETDTHAERSSSQTIAACPEARRKTSWQQIFTHHKSRITFPERSAAAEKEALHSTIYPSSYPNHRRRGPPCLLEWGLVDPRGVMASRPSHPSRTSKLQSVTLSRVCVFLVVCLVAHNSFWRRAIICALFYTRLNTIGQC